MKLAWNSQFTRYKFHKEGGATSIPESDKRGELMKLLQQSRKLATRKQAMSFPFYSADSVYIALSRVSSDRPNYQSEVISIWLSPRIRCHATIFVG